MKKRVVDSSHITIWVILVITTILVILLPKVHIKNKLGVIFSLYVIFGQNYIRSFQFIFVCLTLFFNPSNDRFCMISKILFRDMLTDQNIKVLEKYKGKIFICNYPEFNLIEYFIQGLLPQNYVLVINKKSTNLYESNISYLIHRKLQILLIISIRS